MAIPDAEPPPEIVGDEHMLTMWRRSRHILPAAAFAPEYRSTVLLPVRLERSRQDICRLGEMIAAERCPTQVLIVRRASEQFGLKRGRTTLLLHARRGFEWDYRFTDKPSGRYCFSLISDSSLFSSVPESVPIEYLVAELERHHVKFETSKGFGFSWQRNFLPLGEINVWIKERMTEIGEYLRVRDDVPRIVRRSANDVL